MSENRRSFLRRGVQLLAVAVPAVAVVSSTEKAEAAGRLRARLARFNPRRKKTYTTKS
jgi:hypothetical protein